MLVNIGMPQGGFWYALEMFLHLGIPLGPELVVK
jgi:hypothetical protein